VASGIQETEVQVHCTKCITEYNFCQIQKHLSDASFQLPFSCLYNTLIPLIGFEWRKRRGRSWTTLPWSQ